WITRSGLNFPCTDSLKSSNQAWKHGRRSDGNVVLSKYCPDVLCECRQATDRAVVGCQIGFGTVEPDRGRIVSISGEQQSVGMIEQRNSVGSVSGREKNLERASAQIEVVPIVDVGSDLPGPRHIAFRIKSVRQRSANLARGHFGLRVLSRS